MFFITVNLIFLNIVFGIIVDTFSELRLEQEERDENMKNTCFVCGLTRLDFNKRGKNFDEHQLNEHNPVKYIYY